MNWEEFQGRLPDVGAMSAQTVVTNAVAAALAGVVVWATLYVLYKTSKWTIVQGIRTTARTAAWLFTPKAVDQRQVLADRLVALFTEGEGWELNDSKQTITKRPLESTKLTFSPGEGVKVDGRPLADLALTTRQIVKVIAAAAARRIEMVRAAAIDVLVPHPAQPDPGTPKAGEKAGEKAGTGVPGWQVSWSFTKAQVNDAVASNPAMKPFLDAASSRACVTAAESFVPGAFVAPINTLKSAPGPDGTFTTAGAKPGQLPGAVYAVYAVLDKLDGTAGTNFFMETHVDHLPYIRSWLAVNAAKGRYAVLPAGPKAYDLRLVKEFVDIV